MTLNRPLSLTIATLSVLFLSALPAVAQIGNQPGDTTLTDHLSVVSRAPGVPEGSFFAGFENNESVSMYNGNLVVTHPSSLPILIDGGRSIALNRVYNSKNVGIERTSNGGMRVNYLQIGSNGPGYGWTMHLGRIYRRSTGSSGDNDTCGLYTRREVYFEDAQGTQYRISPGAMQAHPHLEVTFYSTESVCGDFDWDDDGHVDNWKDSPNNREKGTHWLGDEITCEASTNGEDYFEVVMPDGTIYRLREHRSETPLGSAGYLKQYGGTGWFTTEIIYPSPDPANPMKVDVEYHPNRAFIKKVSYTHTDGTTAAISTTLWVKDEPADLDGDGQYDEQAPDFYRALLKNVSTTVADGSTLDYEFYYEQRDVDNSSLHTTTTVLTEARLPEGARIKYTYTDLAGISSSRVPRLETVTYPGDGVTQYAYGPYIAGMYPFCPETCHEPCNDPDAFLAQCGASDKMNRREIGVISRTRYPAGTNGPSATWTWDRWFGRSKIMYDTTTYNYFIQNNPDGTSVEQSYYGAFTGNTGMEGNVEYALTKSADGTVLRQEHYEYDFDEMPHNAQECDDAYTEIPGAQMIRKTTTTYTAAESACGTLESGGVTQRLQVEEYFDYEPDWNHYRMRVIEGDYLKNGVKRVEYTHYFDPDNIPSGVPDFGTAHITELYDYGFVEEGGQRYERNFSWTDEGRLDVLRAKDEWLSASTDFTDPDDPVAAANVTTDDGTDLNSDSDYDDENNLDKISYRRGSTEEYVADFDAVQYGRPTKLCIDDCGTHYPLQDVDINTAGWVTAARDSNGRNTAFSWDDLGRLTQITPFNSAEYSTRMAYASDFSYTRIIQSSGTETVLNTSDDGQLYSDLIYDGLGRTIQRSKAMPDGLAIQVVRYDQMGRVIFESEWMPEDEFDDSDTTPVNVGTWQDGNGYSVKYPVIPGTTDPRGTIMFHGVPDAADPLNPLVVDADPLGRVRKVRRTDGSEVDTGYCGPHKQVTAQIMTESGSTSATTRYYYDGLGRLAVVDAPEGTDASYEYDALGNLTDVNLTEFAGGDLFGMWKSGTLPVGQTREFEFDAAGRLTLARNPENGHVFNDRYDVWGNLLAYRDQKAYDRLYFFENTYDDAGRLIQVEKVRGTPDSPDPTDVDRIGGEGDFESGLGSWVEGTIDWTAGTFTAGDSYWKPVTYGSLGCLDPPQDDALNTAALYFGQTTGNDACTYADAPAEPQAIRRQLTGLTRDDFVSLSFWRQVREAAGDLDAFSVFLVEATEGNSVGNRRYLFRMDETQSSFSRWRQTFAMRPGDLYTQDEWPESTSVFDLYLYIVFEKGDTEHANIGTGLVIDDILVGRRGVEVLAEYAYDLDMCAGGEAGEACLEGEETDNAHLNQLSRVRSYQDGRLVAEKHLVYKGLNGRLSGVQQCLDWEGMGELQCFVTRNAHEAHGLVDSTVWPYQPGLNPARRYAYAYKRGLTDGLWDAAGDTFLRSDTNAVVYTPAGGIETLTLNTGAKTHIEPDSMYRPQYITASTGSVEHWNSGVYAYDGAGNIYEIGEHQSFAYDLAGRLTAAHVIPQATDPGQTTPIDISYSYDIYGNMTDRAWSTGWADAPSPPANFAFAGRNHGLGWENKNQIEDSGFDYDPTGNMTRMVAGHGGNAAMTWDDRNRMTSYYNGNPGVDGLPAERYLYDADGYRVVRLPEGAQGDGRPVISIRDGAGQLLAEFAEAPADGSAAFQKDFVYGAGQLLVEREKTGGYNTLSTNYPLEVNGSYGIKITAGPEFDSYAVDIRTHNGVVSQLTGVVPDASGVFWIDEADLALDETNFIRVKGEDGSPQPYSPPVTLAIDSSVTPSSPNQVRTMTVSRDGDDILVRWDKLVENGQYTHIHWVRADDGTSIDLTPGGLSPVVESIWLADQGEMTSCGRFQASLATTTDPTDPGSELGGSTGGGSLPITEPECPEEPAPGDPEDIVFANSFHHRDHLGSLRVVTDDAGANIGAHDYYPFGTEIQDDPGGGSRKRFTGHERDENTQLDYMLARYYGSNLGRFLSVDPLDPVASNSNSKRGGPLFARYLRGPQNWNRYAYVLNNPLRLTDPSGELGVDATTKKSYPKAAKFIRKMKVRFGKKEFAAFKKHGQASKKDVKKALKKDKGPTVKGSNLSGANGQFTPNTGSQTLEIDNSVLQSFESGAAGSKALLESTVKHELTHYFDDQDGQDQPGEEGEAFEKDVYGQDIDTLQDGQKAEAADKKKWKK